MGCIENIMNFVLNNNIAIYIILSLILVMVLCVTKITFRTLFSKVKCIDLFIFFLLLVSIISEMYILIENSTFAVTNLSQLILLCDGMVSLVCITMIFSKRKNIKNKDFVVCTGILALMQAVLSMKISNLDDVYIFNVSFMHGAIYIIIPAFLIYQITPSNKEILKKLENDKQDIDLKQLNTSINQKKRRKICRFF